MNEKRVIKAYSYTEWGDYKAIWRPDLMAAFYEKELKLSDEPQFLYEVTIPFPTYAGVSFHGAWESKSITSDCLIFVKAERRSGYAWLIYVKFAFLESEDTPVFTILRREGVDGIVFRKIRVLPKPE